MKKTILVILIVFLKMSLTYSQDIEKYRFPIAPSDAEWKTNSYAERLKILNVEEETLKNLSNIQLIGACLDFQYTINLYAFNSLDEGYENVFDIFNGLRELHKRNDIGKDLIYFYSKMGLDGFGGELDIYNENFDLTKFTFFEVLLSREEIILKMDQSERGQLVDECVKKYRMKEECKQQFEGEPIINELEKKLTLAILCRMILIDGDKLAKEQAEEFLLSRSFETASINDIISLSQELY